MMFKIGSGKTEINLLQIVSAHRDKNGDHWEIQMTDNKTFSVTKGEYAQLREKMAQHIVKLVCNVEG